MVSDLWGPGAIVVVFDSEAGLNSFPLLSGTWSLSFADAAFSARGLVTANFNAERTILVLFFDRGPVPCPAEPGGLAQRGIVASMTVSQTRMHGTYVAGGCPGGSMDLRREQELTSQRGLPFGVACRARLRAPRSAAVREPLLYRLA